MESIKEKMDKDGFVIIEDFLNEEEINKLKALGKEFTREAAKEGKKAVFGSNIHYQDQYFLDSGDKIRYFYEKVAFNENGDLQVNEEFSLNKVGHALHTLDPAFKNVTFSDKVKEVCHKLQLEEPVVVQSMYIYKNPRIGSEVNKHQDSTYLHTTPVSLYGFWLALDDATEENGCLQFAPGSHLDQVHELCIRDRDNAVPTESVSTIGEQREVPDDLYVAAPVKKGSCILLHGNVLHCSDQNKSLKPRNAYTFHVYDSKVSIWSKGNWIQTYFPPIYN